VRGLEWWYMKIPPRRPGGNPPRAMTDRAAPITIAGSPLADTRHVCAFFDSEEQEYRVLLPFVTDGIDRGDEAVHLTGADRREARHAPRPPIA
jgi:hypothetical protein